MGMTKETLDERHEWDDTYIEKLEADAEAMRRDDLEDKRNGDYDE